MYATIEESFEFWRSVKRFFELNGTLTPTHLHVVVGTLGFLLVFFLLGRTAKAAIVAIIAVFALQTLNEIIDVFFSVTRKGDIYVKNTIKDYFFTLIFPAIMCVFLLTRYARIWGLRKIGR